MAKCQKCNTIVSEVCESCVKHSLLVLEITRLIKSMVYVQKAEANDTTLYRFYGNTNGCINREMVISICTQSTQIDVDSVPICNMVGRGENSTMILKAIQEAEDYNNAALKADLEAKKENIINSLLGLTDSIGTQK